MKQLLLFVILFAVVKNGLSAQTIINRDPLIYGMVSEISRENIEKSIRTLVSFHTRQNMSAKDQPGNGIGAAWQYLYDSFSSNIPRSDGRLSVEYVDYSAGGKGSRISNQINLKNVVATLKGTNPDDDRIILISAHFDSRAEGDRDSTGFAPGANDDGSGIAALLEMVRIMSTRQFPVTIVFTAVSGEEHGLLGASFMAKKAITENWNIIAMLNNDMIGNSGSSGTLLNDNMKVRVFSEGVPLSETEAMAAVRKATSGENDSKARQLARYIKEVGERYVDQLSVTLVYRNDRFGRGGDHTPFCQQGFTAVRITEFNENYDRTHQTPRLVDGVQYGDLPEYVDYEYVRKNTGLNLASIANMALAPASPENVGVIVAGLSNSTTLIWDPPARGEKPAGYYILMRETCQPMWQKKIRTEGTTVTLPYSKDNYFFGVQSVDAEGHESLAVFPVPVRKDPARK